MAPVKPTLEMRVLERAVELLGNERALARRLRVPMYDLQAWMKGTERPPRALFLETVDVLIERGQLMPLERAPSSDAAVPASPAPSGPEER
jgi:hypothetical protein